MKKFYAFAAAALCAFAANAQDGAPLYITGQAFAPSDDEVLEGVLPALPGGNWNTENPGVFEFVDGVYKISVKGLSSFTISTAMGSWDAWQEEGKCFTCEYGDVQGVAKELTSGKANILTPWQGDWDVEVAGDLSTITLTTETPEPPVKIYLRGDMNNWLNGASMDTEGDKWLLEKVSSKIFKFTCAEGQSIMPDQTFKIADAGWAKYNYGATGPDAILLDVDTEVWFNSGDNMKVEEEFTGVMWLTLDLDGLQYVVFSNDKEFEPEWAGESGVSSIAADSNVAVKYFNLQGVQVANPENGLFIVVKGDKASKVLVK